MGSLTLYFFTGKKDMQEIPGTAALTIKGQVAKKSCQKIHAVHDKDGKVGHFLHLLLRWTEIRNLNVMRTPHSAPTCYQISRGCKGETHLRSSVYMGRTSGWQTKAKAKMGIV